MVRWVVCVIGLLGVLAAGEPAAARADWDSAAAAYDRGDDATAFAEWQRLAERGDAAAQYMLGFMQASGQGVT